MKEREIWLDDEINILLNLRNKNQTAQEIRDELEKRGYKRSRSSVDNRIKRELKAGNVKGYEQIQTDEPVLVAIEELSYRDQDQLNMVAMIRRLKRGIKVGDTVLGHKVLSVSKNFIVISLGAYRETYTWQELYTKGVKR